MKVKILIIDDETIIAKSLEIFLGFEGFDAMICKPSEKFINYFETFRPNLLVTDYFMSNLTGEEVIKTIREKITHFPIIIITGFKKSVSIQEDDYLKIISKPFFNGELLNVINIMLKL